MQTNEKIQITPEEIVPTAEKMRAENRLLIMIHGHMEKDGTPVVSYDYDDGANVLSYEVRGHATLPTISHIYDAAAQWAERDVAELVPITFEGLDCSQRLFMPDNLLSGQGQITVTPLNVLREENQL
ncbi:MAG TPA: NADH-quinone oxidoreductase subunit C [Candidatus Enterenecus avicola]|nr:NADH-quinone oxidoreductase subunit C [Candidatus Enterenecus avicola]